MDLNAQPSGAATRRILWFLFLATPLFYIPVAALLSRARGDAAAPSEILGTLRAVFAVLGAALLLGSAWSRRRLLRRASRAGIPGEAGEQIALVAGWAMLEAIAVLGLVLFVFGAGWPLFLVYVAVSFIGVLRQPPDRHRDAGGARGDPID